MEPLRSDIEECYIGIEQKPKLIKLSKAIGDSLNEPLTYHV